MKTTYTWQIIMAVVLQLTFCKHLAAQVNLVNNSGFEILTNSNICPNDLGELNLCSGWKATGESPDYFNACGSSTVGVPQNFNGHQNAASGQAYAGFVFLWAIENNGFSGYREYLGTHLTQTLIPGTKYYLSMQVSMAESWQEFMPMGSTTSTWYPTYMPCNKIGLKFYTKEHTAYQFYDLVNDSAHLYAHNIISDTTNWTSVRGSFIADSAYTHIVIGNFFHHGDTLKRDHGWLGYYYVDDIIVTTDSTVLNVGLKQNKLDNENFTLFPNPVIDKLSFKSNNNLPGNLKLSISNALGKIVFTKNNLDPKQELDLSFLQSGIYSLKVESDESQRIFKFVKE